MPGVTAGAGLGDPVVPTLIRALALCALLAAGAAPAAEAVQLVAQAPVMAGLATFPRLAPGMPQAARINAALATADARVRTAVEECRAVARGSAADPATTGWTRSIAIAMQGPRYLALVADDYFYCGGPYPNAERFALVYDLHTGLPPNWPRLLPKTLVRTHLIEAAFDATPLGMVDSPALKSIYLAAVQGAAAKLDPGCPATLQQLAGPFMFWPDAQQGGIAVQPSRLAHAAAACGMPVTISVAALRRLGVNPALLDAVGAAHRAGRGINGPLIGTLTGTLTGALTGPTRPARQFPGR